MKMRKWILAGALMLLASVVVIGCKSISGGDTEELEKISNKEYVWRANNPSTAEYKRVFQQFGTSENITEATIEVTAKYPKNGWSGVMFLMGKASAADTYSAYILAFRHGNPTSTAANPKVQMYLSYYDSINPKDVASGQELAGGVSLIDTQDIPAALESVVKVTEEGLKFQVKLEAQTTETEGIKISVGDGTGNVTNLPDNFLSSTATTDGWTLSNGVLKNTTKMTTNKGGIGLYGQLTKAQASGTGPSAETRYKVIDSKPTIVLSAEDAE